MRQIRTSWIVGSAITLATVALALQVTNPKLPPPFHSPSADNRPKVIPRPGGAELHCRTVSRSTSTLKVSTAAFHAARTQPRNSGERQRWRAVAFMSCRTKTRTSRLKSSRSSLMGLDRPYGLALWKDYLYIAEATRSEALSIRCRSDDTGPGRRNCIDERLWQRTLDQDRVV